MQSGIHDNRSGVNDGEYNGGDGASPTAQTSPVHNVGDNRGRVRRKTRTRFLPRARRQVRSRDVNEHAFSITQTLRESLLRRSATSFPSRAEGLNSVCNGLETAVAWSPFPGSSTAPVGRVVGILLQTAKRPVRAACVSFCIWVDSNNQNRLSAPDATILKRCSCLEPSIWTSAQLTCEHARYICKPNIRASVKALLFQLLQLDTERVARGIQTDARTIGSGSGSEEEECSASVFALVSGFGAPLCGMRRTNSRRQTFYILFDEDTTVALPLLHRRNGRMQCFGCEAIRGSRNACDHIEVCDTAKVELDASLLTDSNGCGNDGPGEGGGESETCPSLMPLPQQYCSFRNRRLFMCPSERAALREILRRVGIEDDHLHLSDPIDEIHCPFETIDSERPHSVDVSVPILRYTLLHTLLHGDVRVCVADYKCSYDRIVWFDGFSQAVFSASRDHLYTKDILESYLISVCVNDTSFREAYLTVNNIRKSVAASFVASTTQPAQRDDVIGTDRRAANDAFNNFLHCVNGTYAEGSHTPQLDRLHTCEKCECEVTAEPAGLAMDGSRGSQDEPENQLYRTNGTRRRFRGVVVDGTATGILAELPPYVRHILKVEHIPNVPRRFIINEEGRNRVLKDAVLRLVTAAKKGCLTCPRDAKCPNFRVTVQGGTLQNQRDALSEIFYPGASDENPELGANPVVGNILKAAYSKRIRSSPECGMQ